jgi:glucosamine--fructose-6-phosphate aminotransferase (isomerizing)
MTEMIEAEPALASRIAVRIAGQPALAQLVSVIQTAARTGAPITTTGCGTSEHAAMAIAALLTDALRTLGHPRPVAAAQAFELSRGAQQGGVVIAVSHEGGTEATNGALAAARGVADATALITVSDRSPGAALADLVLCTEEQDQSWCHTVGYLSPIVVGACLYGALTGSVPDPAVLQGQLSAATDVGAAEIAAAAFADVTRFVAVGSGADFSAARELALKIEEGTHLPAVAHELETLRHGHLAAADERSGLVVFLTDGENRGRALEERALAVLRAGAALGMPASVIAASDRAGSGRDLAVAGWQSVALEPSLPRAVSAILASTIPLQLLTERLARARGVNPDPIGRDDPRQAAAASV